MTRYFMKFTPLFAAEVQMMTPPRHQPRRSGRIRSSFRYSADDVRCKDCTRYDSGHPCHLNECVCLEERIEAGVVELNALARECFGGRMFRPLQRRLRDELNRQPFRFFLGDAHRERWRHWKNRCYGMSERNAAALFLLTADEGLWQRVLWHFDSSGFDFPAIRLSGIHPELYSIYQAAKTISVGGDNIVIEDLAFSELVSARAFRLILGALLLCRHGEVVLNLEKNGGDNMMIQAVLSNPSHPEYGVATIPFPIPHDQYAHCMELLEALEIGDAVKADCKVEKIDSFYTVLKRTEMLTVNVEELNYLAKRLDSFDTGEAAQFQAMAHKLELFELKDLINLTFCCQQATVITDFSDLDAVGRNHYMNLHGGSASVDELNKLDGEGTARQLIESGGGTITPYGVVYDNGMKLEQIYDGRFFPCYYYEPNAITVAVTSKAEPEDTEHITWLFLPMVQEEIDRALLRGGITDPADVRLRLEDSQLPNEVDVLLDMEYETLSDLNELAEATDGLSKADMEKLGAVVMLAEPKSAAQIKNLAESLDLFDFAPGAHTPQEYGKYMIQQSGRFEYDENLDAFYDYEKYGAQRMNEEDGMFTDRGYIAYKGYYSMEEVMNGSQSSHMEMGGMM